MKSTFVIALLLLSISASAQKIRYSDKRNHWLTKGDQMSLITWLCDHTCFLSFGADTAINGVVYQPLIINIVYEPYYCGSIGIGNGPAMYIREDTLANIVYSIYAAGMANDTVEHVLYNFNLNVGDTIRYKGITGVFVDSVLRIDSAMINGINHKVFTMDHTANNPGGGYSGMYTIIEGVGSLGSYCHPFSYCFERWEQLVCFAQDYDTGPAFVPIRAPFNACSQPFDSLNTTLSCRTLSIDIHHVHEASISITPNPAADQINIVLSGNIAGVAFISVYDVSGKCIYRSTEQSLKQTISINTSLWADGLYMVLIQNEDGIVKKEKVVIMK